MSVTSYGDAAAAILTEALDARTKFPPFNSAHEGWAVLYEEVDEIWDEVRADNLDAAIAEAIIKALRERSRLNRAHLQKLFRYRSSRTPRTKRTKRSTSI